MRKIIWILFFVATVSGCNGIQEHEFPIVSIERDLNIEGSFFLGSGSISERMYYFTYAVLLDGGYYLVKIPSGVSIIYETNAISPRVHVTWNSTVTLNGFSFRDSCLWKSVRIYVPLGTIIKEFKL